MIINSYRFKNIVYLMIILTILLSFFGFFLYTYLRNKLYSDIDKFLITTAVSVADSIDTLIEAEKNKALEKGISEDSVDEIIHKYFFKIIKSWIIKDDVEDPKFLNIFVQIYDDNGVILTSSKKVHNQLKNLSKDSLIILKSGKEYFEEIIVEEHQGKYNTLRFLSYPILENKRLLYIVRVAISLRTMNFALNNLKIILLIVIPFVIIITGILGYFLIYITLKPVNKMIDLIEQITAKNLKLRINIPESKDEIRKLANTFNNMLDRLENSFLSQKQLIEDLSHELKTPLSVIKGEIEVALKRNRNEKEYKEILKSNIDEINKIIKLLENLLMISKFDSKIANYEPQKINLTNIIENIICDFRILSEQNNINIEYKLEPNIFFIGDEMQIKSMIINLIDNAMKYSNKNGKIIINLFKEKNNIKIIISDNGVGISDDDIPYIFDRYYRVLKSLNTEGFGLGLSIVKSIVETHRGKIEVKSRLNEGTTFTILFPVDN